MRSRSIEEVAGSGVVWDVEIFAFSDRTATLKLQITVSGSY
jgi:hypothetical protein